MPLNKLDNFIKNTEGRILYVNPNDLDATDGIENQGNSLTKPFKTIQRALIEAARFSYLRGSNNDLTEKTTILLFPGDHLIDNRPGFAIKDVGGTARAVAPSGQETNAVDTLSLTLDSNFDLTQEDNILYKFNSISGGVIVPRGTSIVGLDLRKSKIKPKYVPNPTDSSIGTSAIFKITGGCYFWQFTVFDGDETGLVYTSNTDFSELNQSKPSFSHHKLTVFEYADGMNTPSGYNLTDLDMYYSKLSNSFNLDSGRNIDQKYPSETLGFAKQRSEWEIIGAFATDPVNISNIISGDGIAPTSAVTVTTAVPHNLTSETPIKIRGVGVDDYNISTKVQNVLSETEFTYLLPFVRANLPAAPTASGATVTIETDTVSGASPYVFNVSLRSVWGMNGIHADGNKASGFRSMTVAQFTGISLQKDDRAFVKYNPTSRLYEGISISKVTGSSLSSGSSSTDSQSVYHLDSGAVYRNGWETAHIKASNDGFIQVVSVFAIGFAGHFVAESGGDQSITNSNSNFGQLSIKATGFKKEAFNKDDAAYITSIVSPRAITRPEENIDWLTIDVGLTTSVGISSHLYIYGFSARDDVPPNIVQGYRVGAKREDKLYLTIGAATSEANVYMCDNFTTFATGTTSSFKIYTVTSGPTNNIFTLNENHKLKTGEKVKITADTGDFPENIDERTIYYVIANDVDISLSANQIKLASSQSNASLDNFLKVYGGSSVSIISAVSEKNPGDVGAPIQYDSVNQNWFIHVNQNNQIYNNLLQNGVAVLGEKTNATFFKRVPDPRSLDEKIYKLRVVIPKESSNSRDPLEGYIIQESSFTGARGNQDFTQTSIGTTDHSYNRNPRFISTCSTSSNTVTVISEIPHDLKVNDIIIVSNVTDTVNTLGTKNLGYNGTFAVTSIANDLTFTYSTTDVEGTLHSTGTFTNNTSNRTTLLPRFERLDLQSNFFIYRNEVISSYVENVQDGVYYLYVLNSGNTIPTEFTTSEYSQNVIDLYPQLDRDNINENPAPTKTFAKRYPIGDVSTSDLRNSVTKETVDILIKDFGKAIGINSVGNNPTSAEIHFLEPHGLSGIVTYSSLTGGTGHDNGTYYNVKLYNENGLTSWDGATAKVVISGGSVVSLDIQSPGSGYNSGETLWIDVNRIGGAPDASITIANSGITTNIGDVVQFTGAGTTSDSYHRIITYPAKDRISIAKTAGDPVITNSQYAVVIGPSIIVSSSSYNSTTGITTFNCSGPHGLLSGNKFKITDANNNNLGDYIVRSRVGVNTFTAITNKSVSPKYILKHGLSANDAIADSTEENIGIRDFFFYDNDILRVVDFTSDTQIRVSSPLGSAIPKRFPLGSYIQIDNEIMRVASSTLSGAGNDEITVLRSVLGTNKTSHDNGSLIRKINLIPIEFRRPTILRASGHTFEYLGFGPGNYSTGLPQIQVRTLTEKEEFLSQAQQLSCGSVVYSGMNSNGDFYVGNKRLSSQNGEETVFGAPIPTVTGEDPSRLSVVFDEVTVKERIVVEGGNSGKILSQFDGPVTFNQDVKVAAPINLTSSVRVTDTTQSTSGITGSVVLSGGLGISKNVYINENLNVIGITTLTDLLDANGGATIDNIRIGIANNNEIDTSSGNLTIDSAGGTTTLDDNVIVTGTLTVYGNTILGNASSDITTVIGDLRVTQDITAFYSSDERLKDNITPIDDPLAKVLSISGNTYDWNEKSGKEGHDVGVIAQEILKVLPEAVTTRDNGYLAVDYQKIVPLLVEAIKELSGKVEKLEQKLQDK